MPVSGREEAIAWVVNTHPKYIGKVSENNIEDGAGGSLERGGDLAGLDLHSTVARFREIEFRTWQDMDAALLKRKELETGTKPARDLDAAISQLSKRYREASTDRLNIEQRVADFELETGRRISVDQAKAWVDEKVAGLVVRLDALPFTEDRNCNPADPETARLALRNWKEAVKLQQRDLEGVANE